MVEVVRIRRVGAGAGGRSRTGTGLSALRIFVPLRLSPRNPALSMPESSGSGLSLHPSRAALGAARLVSTPSRFRAWLGIAI
jgi:hypothetical protein